MNWLKSILIGSVSALAFCFVFGCGVKGDPIPPERPAELGRGRPTYRRATEGIKIKTHKKLEKFPNEEEEEDEDDGI